MHFTFIIKENDASASVRKGLEQRLREYDEMLRQRGDDYDIYTIEGEGDGARYTRIYNDLHPAEDVCFVACGGDSMVNEVASGVAGFERKSMAILSLDEDVCGFTACYPQLDFTNLGAILQGDFHNVDIIKVNDSYSLNVCSIGFDATISKRFHLQGPNKKHRRLAKLEAVVLARYNRVDVVADGIKLGRKHLLSCTIANGCCENHGAKCAPQAVNDDGLLEVCYVKPMSLLRLVCALPLYVKGEHLKRRSLSRFLISRQAKRVVVDAKDLIEITVDGEILPGVHFEIEVLPQAISLLLPSVKDATVGEKHPTL